MIAMHSALAWLATPLSGAQGHAIEPWAAWHARLMVLSWNLLLPLGMLVARFFKVAPGQNWPDVLDRKFWWRSHLWLQGLGVAAMTLGLAPALFGAHLSTPAARLHHLSGWAIVAIGWLQVLGGWFRGDKGGPTEATLRGDHYDMTARRVAFEAVHKHLGWTAVPLTIFATGLGLAIAEAPRWMPLVLGAWWVALIVAFVHWQRAGRCIDTYQAIWGPDPTHPGNRRNPIGWGVARPRADGSERGRARLRPTKGA